MTVLTAIFMILFVLRYHPLCLKVWRIFLLVTLRIVFCCRLLSASRQTLVADCLLNSL